MPSTQNKLLWRPVFTALAVFGPICLILIADAFLLPVNSFTFRQWEALMTKQGQNLDYSFFPGTSLTQWEYGDTHRYNTYQQPRMTRWVTDEIGYRNKNAYKPDMSYCFVVMGDSNIIGSSLDQSETLSSILERKESCPVYNAAAPGYVQRFFYHDRFRDNPPKFLLFQTIAGHFYTDNAYSLFNVNGQLYGRKSDPSLFYHIASRIIGFFSPDSLRATPWILEDIVHRQTFLRFARARLGFSDLPSQPSRARHNEFRNITTSQSSLDQTQPMYHGTVRYPSPTASEGLRDCPEEILVIADVNARLASCRFVAITKAMANVIEPWGTELIVYLQPSSDEYLKYGIAFLERSGYKIIHFPHNTLLPYGIDFDWYWATDDTHWHPRAVEMAADLILAESRGQSAEEMLPAIHIRVKEEIRQLRFE